MNEIRCLNRKRNIRCWGKLKALNSWDEFADFICPVCGAYYTLDWLEEQEQIRKDNNDQS